MNGVLGRCGRARGAPDSGDREMSARKRIRAVKCMDCEAVLKAENDAALVDVLGKHYISVHRTRLMTEDRIREQIAADARDT